MVRKTVKVIINTVLIVVRATVTIMKKTVSLMVWRDGKNVDEDDVNDGGSGRVYVYEGFVDIWSKYRENHNEDDVDNSNEQ